MADFYIATEDPLSEAVVERIIAVTGHTVADKIPKDRRYHAGFGYLKAKLPSLVKACQGGLHFFVLTDLDARPCPPDLLEDWFGPRPKPDTLLLRVAVREVEAWVLADREKFSHWLGLPEQQLPVNPEACRDPKADLLALVKTSKNRILKDGLLPKRGAPSKVGLEYNDLLRAFVSSEWRVEEAARLAPSLNRTIQRLREFQ